MFLRATNSHVVQLGSQVLLGASGPVNGLQSVFGLCQPRAERRVAVMVVQVVVVVGGKVLHDVLGEGDDPLVAGGQLSDGVGRLGIGVGLQQRLGLLVDAIQLRLLILDLLTETL